MLSTIMRVSGMSVLLGMLLRLINHLVNNNVNNIFCSFHGSHLLGRVVLADNAASASVSLVTNEERNGLADDSFVASQVKENVRNHTGVGTISISGEAFDSASGGILVFVAFASLGVNLLKRPELATSGHAVHAEATLLVDLNTVLSFNVSSLNFELGNDCTVWHLGEHDRTALGVGHGATNLADTVEGNPSLARAVGDLGIRVLLGGREPTFRNLLHDGLLPRIVLLVRVVLLMRSTPLTLLVIVGLGLVVAAVMTTTSSLGETSDHSNGCNSEVVHVFIIF